MIEITVQEVDGSRCNGVQVWFHDRYGRLTLRTVGDASDVLTEAQERRYYEKGGIA